MKILVAIRQVPDPTALAFDAAGNVGPNVARVINEYDMHAIEAAIRIAEAGDPGATQVVTLTVGPARARDAIMRALAMGVDRGAHVESDEASLDTLRVAHVIAGEARDGGYDLLLAGQETSDGGTGNVGPQTAGLLDWPLVSNVVDLQVTEAGLTLAREVEDGRHILEVGLPAVICLLGGLNEPRYPSLKGIMAARKKPLEARALPGDLPQPGVRWSQPRSEARPSDATMIQGEPEDVARQLVALLRERQVI